MKSTGNFLSTSQTTLRSIILIGFLALIFVGCDQKSSEDASPILLTGNEIDYRLFSTSDFNISGKIIFKEKNDGTVEVETVLENTKGTVLHPVHIHAGSMTDNGQLLTVLNPVLGSKGSSITTLQNLMVNETKPFLFSELAHFDGSVRVHLNDGTGQSVILAIANIGKNKNLLDSNFAICNDW